MGIHPPFFPADNQIALLDLKTSVGAHRMRKAWWRGGRGGRAAAGGHAGPKVPKIQSWKTPYVDFVQARASIQQKTSQKIGYCVQPLRLASSNFQACTVTRLQPPNRSHLGYPK